MAGAVGTASAFIFGTAGAAIGTTYAFAAFFLLFIDIKCGKTEHNSKNYNNDNIFHKDCSFLNIFLLDLLGY